MAACIWMHPIVFVMWSLYEIPVHLFMEVLQTCMFFYEVKYSNRNLPVRDN